MHTTFGDLLRSLEPREAFGSPQNIVLSREALAAVHYQKGNIVTYTVNGKTLRHVNHSDNIHVSQAEKQLYISSIKSHYFFWFLNMFSVRRLDS